MRQPKPSAGFTLIELLVVIAIISLLASLLTPAAIVCRKRSKRVQCMSNLLQVSQLALFYASNHQDWLPLAAPGAPPHESLQLLVDMQPGIEPEIFVCPCSRDVPAKADAGGSFRLEAHNCSYAWIGQRTATTDPARWALASDDAILGSPASSKENHKGGMVVVRLGGNVDWVKTQDLPEGRHLPLRLVRGPQSVSTK